MIILIASQKGGCGKSTLATNIAVVLANQGRDVLLVDADRQRSASQWAEVRADIDDNAAYIPCVSRYDDIQLALKEYSDVYEAVIVDTAGHDSLEMRSAMLVADIMLIPTRPTQFDLVTLRHISKIVTIAKENNHKLDARVVVTMTQSTTKNDSEGAKEYITRLDNLSLCQASIGDRKIFKESNLTGLGVTEITAKSASDKSGQAELLALTLELQS